MKTKILSVGTVYTWCEGWKTDPTAMFWKIVSNDQYNRYSSQCDVTGNELVPESGRIEVSSISHSRDPIIVRREANGFIKALLKWKHLNQ
jgi:hypothetical protein